MTPDLNNLINKGNGMFVSPDILDQQLRQVCLVNATELAKTYADTPVQVAELIKMADSLYDYVKNGIKADDNTK